MSQRFRKRTVILPSKGFLVDDRTIDRSGSTMEYINTTKQDQSSSALSFTSSTVSASSFKSKDDPTGKSSIFLSLQNILKAVYRCDSAAVVDEDYSCTIANQALYQGVEVILQKATCSNYGNNLKSSVASKPFFEYKCFCDDDDFLVHNENQMIGCWKPNSTKSRHVRGLSHGTLESRNERVSSLGDLDDESDDRRDQTSQHFAGLSTPTNRNTRLTKPTRNFYSKIMTPPSRSVTRLHDVNNAKATMTKPMLEKQGLSSPPSLDPAIEAEELAIATP